MEKSTLKLENNVWTVTFLLLIFPLISMVLSYIFMGKSVCLVVSIISVLISIIALLILYAIILTIYVWSRVRYPEDRSRPFVEFLVLADNSVEGIFKDKKIPDSLHKEQVKKIRVIESQLRQIARSHIKLMRKKANGKIENSEFKDKVEELNDKKEIIIEQSKDIFEDKE